MPDTRSLPITTPQAGTTLMQQVCHQLRTGGDDSFDEISAEGVAPFIELAADCGIALDAQQPAAPRLFKSHCWEPHCPKGARYIIVVRNPHACAVSFYSFFEVRECACVHATALAHIACLSPHKSCLGSLATDFVPLIRHEGVVLRARRGGVGAFRSRLCSSPRRSRDGDAKPELLAPPDVLVAASRR